MRVRQSAFDLILPRRKLEISENLHSKSLLLRKPVICQAINVRTIQDKQKSLATLADVKVGTVRAVQVQRLIANAGDGRRNNTTASRCTFDSFPIAHSQRSTRREALRVVIAHLQRNVLRSLR